MSSGITTGRGAEILLSYNQELFMLLRDDKADISAQLQWVVPAGSIEVGETDSEAMNRELMEELGISIEITWIGKYRGYTWFVGTLSDQDIGAVNQGEGCARGLFSINALTSLAKVEGKGGLGGTIRQIMQRNPQALRAFLTNGTLPDVSRLMVG